MHVSLRVIVDSSSDVLGYTLLWRKREHPLKGEDVSNIIHRGTGNGNVLLSQRMFFSLLGLSCEV